MPVSRPGLLVTLLLALLMVACQPAASPADSTYLFEDDFSTSGGGWGVWDREGASVRYASSGLLLKTAQQDLNVWSVSGNDFSDVILSVQANPVQGSVDNLFGLICRYKDERNFYYLVVTSDGYYGIGRAQEGSHSLVGMDMMQFSEMIERDQSSYTLTAACVGPKLTLAVDGNLLAEVEDDTFTHGDVGLLAGSYQSAEVEVLFDNFTVRAPE